MHSTSIQEEILRDALGVAGLSVQISSQRMMGGFEVSIKKHPFAHISSQGTGLRLSPEDRTALLAIPGAKALLFPADPARSAKFVLVPEPMRFSTTNTAISSSAKLAFKRTRQTGKK
jgi:hypothetical protein